ncbi:hypothetical protein L1987_68185 [Smallanthus sonchifolius]|uniref:Uncharacterized protein n=1 Tax=Smallanthus sonchifolius TaxID=185202 RepID=A0ACB9B5S9_9ASTR|nr:hypothetical protein L1987_68185 [Smallanthus sonchifolius]
MAATTTVAVLLLLTLSTTIHARESQFFAKVSNNNPQETQPLNTNQQNVDYGHESGQLPPSATTKDGSLPSYLPENYNPVAYTTPIHSTTQDIPEEFKEPQTYNGESTMYNSEKQGMSDTRFLENGKYYYSGDNGYNSPKQGFEDARFMETEDGGNMYNSEKQGEEMYNSQKQVVGETRYGTTNNANMYKTGKQGLSDTRFLENGKYYYDVNSENLNANTNMNSREFNSKNEYNTQGYYGNNENSYDRYNSNGNTQGYYGNNENSYDRYNSNGGYQNQEEFQGDQFNP